MTNTAKNHKLPGNGMLVPPNQEGWIEAAVIEH